MEDTTAFNDDMKGMKAMHMLDPATHKAMEDKKAINDDTKGVKAKQMLDVVTHEAMEDIPIRLTLLMA